MSAHKNFPEANEKYVSELFTEKKAGLPIAPGRKLAVVTCMDARIDPLRHLGLEIGDAHIIRNAGGVAREAIRSIVISQRLLGTREIAIFHHTNCGMTTFTTPQLREQVHAESGARPGVAEAVDNIDFLEFPTSEEAVAADAKWLKEHPLVLPGTGVTGWIYEVETGKIKQIY